MKKEIITFEQKLEKFFDTLTNETKKGNIKWEKFSETELKPFSSYFCYAEVEGTCILLKEDELSLRAKSQTHPLTLKNFSNHSTAGIELYRLWHIVSQIVYGEVGRTSEAWEFIDDFIQAKGKV